jgi:hypothetical protein
VMNKWVHRSKTPLGKKRKKKKGKNSVLSCKKSESGLQVVSI